MSYPSRMDEFFIQYAEAICPECGYSWTVKYINDLGRQELIDRKDAICPECGYEIDY